MKANEIKTSKPPKEHVSAECSAETHSLRLGAFFDLLLKIDKRNNPEKYDYQKYRNSANQTPSRADWNSPSRV